MQNRFEIRPDLALAATLKEYTDIYGYDNTLMADVHRDVLLEILSDARVASPMVQTGNYLSKVNPKCYMYVFAHNSEAGEYVHVSTDLKKLSKLILKRCYLHSYHKVLLVKSWRMYLVHH
jgi:neuroligin